MKLFLNYIPKLINKKKELQFKIDDDKNSIIQKVTEFKKTFESTSMFPNKSEISKINLSFENVIKHVLKTLCVNLPKSFSVDIVNSLLTNSTSAYFSILDAKTLEFLNKNVISVIDEFANHFMGNLAKTIEKKYSMFSNFSLLMLAFYKKENHELIDDIKKITVQKLQDLSEEAVVKKEFGNKKNKSVSFGQTITVYFYESESVNSFEKNNQKEEKISTLPKLVFN